MGICTWFSLLRPALSQGEQFVLLFKFNQFGGQPRHLGGWHHNEFNSATYNQRDSPETKLVCDLHRVTCGLNPYTHFQVP